MSSPPSIRIVFANSVAIHKSFFSKNTLKISCWKHLLLNPGEKHLLKDLNLSDCVSKTTTRWRWGRRPKAWCQHWNQPGTQWPRTQWQEVLQQLISVLYILVYLSLHHFLIKESPLCPPNRSPPRAWHKINKMPHPACPVRPPGPKDLKNSDFLIDFK